MFCITTGYLIFLLNVRGWLFISLFVLICCKAFTMVICFCGNHITRAKLCNNFCVSNILCNIRNLSLTLKSLTQVQLDILSSLSQKKQVRVKFFKLILLCVNFLCVSVISEFSTVSVLPGSVSCPFSNRFLFRANFDLIYLA